MSERRDSPVLRLAEARIAILGTGLMGGSLAYALSGHCAALVGVDPDPKTREMARASGIFQEVQPRAVDIVLPVDVWILAAPVRSILATLDDMPEWEGQSGIVLDIGSTKTQITAAMQNLPNRYEPLGGHPMCGKETGSFARAEANLFNEAPFAWCRLERSSSRAIDFAEELTTHLNARPLWISAEIHDRWVAATSHLPYLIANALAGATPAEAGPLVGPGFRSTTRVAGSHPEMMLDILLTNRTEILSAASRFQDVFQALISFLAESDSDELSQHLQAGRHNHSLLLGMEGER